MESLKQTLIKKAQSRYGKIYPCDSGESLNSSFTNDGRQLLFWFNTEDKSTRVLRCFIQGNRGKYI